jgi:hypothetical protein
MKRFWWSAVAVETLALAGFCFAAATSDYFVRMPPGVRHGTSVPEMVAWRAVWLAGIMALLNVSMFSWTKGVRWLEHSARTKAVLALVASVAIFLLTCVLIVAWVMVGSAQY